MTVVVTEKCSGCRYTECVDVCPTSCFHIDEEMVYVSPADCIDCLACIISCPVQAIVAEKDLSEDQLHWAAVNRERSAVLPVIVRKLLPLADSIP